MSKIYVLPLFVMLIGCNTKGKKDENKEFKNWQKSMTEFEKKNKDNWPKSTETIHSVKFKSK